jgi:hypothetical protein
VETAIAKLTKYKLPGSDQIPAGVIETGVKSKKKVKLSL